MVKKANQMPGMITLWIGDRTEIIIKHYINPSGSCLLDSPNNVVKLEKKEKADKGWKKDMEWYLYSKWPQLDFSN